MKNAMIILAAVLLVTAGGILAFNSSSQPSKNNEGLKSTNIACTCS